MSPTVTLLVAAAWALPMSCTEVINPPLPPRPPLPPVALPPAPPSPLLLELQVTRSWSRPSQSLVCAAACSTLSGNVPSESPQISASADPNLRTQCIDSPFLPSSQNRLGAR